MNLSISNIGWEKTNDASAYELMRNYEYSGLEIAPTRIFSESPYDKLEEAKVWKKRLMEDQGFLIPSMQSIWFGRQENIFGSEEERQSLIDYTKKAIDFAEAIGCKNLVFGCPRNRNLPDGAESSTAISFFRELGNYASEHGTVIGMEANPPIYNTNYVNDTLNAITLIEQVASEGFRLNLDVGTMIQNEEAAEELKGKVGLINHVHISEPGLKMIEERHIHREVMKILQDENYQGFISIEMSKRENLAELEQALKYVKAVFCNKNECVGAS